MLKKTAYLLVCLPLGIAQAQHFVTFSTSPPPLPVVAAGNDTTVLSSTSFQLNGSITNGTAPFSISWSPPQPLNDPTILNPTATLTQTTTFTLTVTDSNGCVSTDQVVITVGPTGLKSFEMGNMGIYPNPNSGEFMIDGAPLKETETVELYTANGVKVPIDLSFPGNGSMTVKLRKPQTGLYFLSVKKSGVLYQTAVSIQ